MPLSLSALATRLDHHVSLIFLRSLTTCVNLGVDHLFLTWEKPVKSLFSLSIYASLSMNPFSCHMPQFSLLIMCPTKNLYLSLSNFLSYCRSFFIWLDYYHNFMFEHFYMLNPIVVSFNISIKCPSIDDAFSSSLDYDCVFR